MSGAEAVSEADTPASRGLGAPGRVEPPVGVIDGKWEYRRLRLPPGVSRRVAATQLAIHAEFADWELSNVRLYADGSRRVWLRRRHQPSIPALPGLIT